MATSVILRVKNGKLAGQTYVFDAPQRCLIGRARDCEIALPHDEEFLTVSRHHCLLDVDPPVLRVRDSGSRNGTFVNGMQIGRPMSWHLDANVLARPCFEYDLSAGDELKVGDTVFTVEIEETDTGDPERATEAQLCPCG